MNSALMFSHYGFYCFNLSLLSLSFSHNRMTFYVFSYFCFISGFDLCLLFFSKLKTKSHFVAGLTFLMGQWHEIFKLKRFFLFIIISTLSSRVVQRFIYWNFPIDQLFENLEPLSFKAISHIVQHYYLFLSLSLENIFCINSLYLSI